MKQNNKNPFRDRWFTAEIILRAGRWYLQFPISYRDLERMLADRGVHARRRSTVRHLWSITASLTPEAKLQP